jgi:hypothetical protein
MAQQIKLRRAPGGLEHLPVPGRRGGDRFTLLEVVQPLRIHQLFKMRQLLQAVRLAQGVAERAEVSETCGLKARRDFRVVVGVAVQRNRRRGLQIVQLSPGAQLFIVQRAKPAGGEVERLRFMALRAVGALRPTVIESAKARINSDAVVLLQRGKR